MQASVYRVLTLVSALVVVPIGTNRGLFDLFWMLLTGQVLLSRGAIFPGLRAVGLSDGAHAWAAAPAPGAGRFSERAPLAGATSGESDGDRPRAEGVLGPTTPSDAHVRHIGQS